MIRMSLSRLARLGMIAIPSLGLACSEVPVAKSTAPNPMQALPSTPVDRAMSLVTYEQPASSATVRAASAEAKAMSVSLDTVLRLAEEQNPQIATARSKVEVACTEQSRILSQWLPDIYLGVGYYRHDGGIQLQEGPLINSDTQAMLAGPQIDASFNYRERAFQKVEAARKVWQNQGDLSKISYEQMLDASNTYIDLLAAYSALAISQDLEKKIKELYDKAVKAYETTKTADVEIEKTRIEADLKTQQSTQLKLQGQIESATAKLAYLLGVDPHTPIVPMDTQMAAFHIVDTAQPAEQLVTQALTNGPGVRELEGILGAVQSGFGDVEGPARFLPIVQFQMGEGLFGAGPGGTMAWANRFDMGVQAKWNVSDAFSAHKKRQVALSQINQVQMTYAELKARLALGVQEARTTSLASAAQFAAAEELIKEGRLVAEKTRLLADNQMNNVTGSAVVQAHKAVAMAQLNYVDLMREYDKAQMRLLTLTGSCDREIKPAAAPAGLHETDKKAYRYPAK